MKTKSNTVATNLQQVKESFENELPKSPVQLYNERVQLYTRENPLTDMQAQTILVYLKAWYQSKLTPENFNKEVLKFNNTHGLLIKKVPEQQVFNNVSKEYSYINFALINKVTIQKTLDNFQHFKTDYNQKCKALNKKVAHYNKEVVINKAKLTDSENKRVAAFKKKHNPEFTRVYNACVDFENEDRAIHPKIKYQTIKDQAEQVFRTCVNFYVSQLRQFNDERVKLGRTTRFEKKDQPMFVLNHKSITDYQLNGIKRITSSKRTVKNQIKRLKEAGIFTTWLYSGFQRPIYCHFNPKIFVLIEGKAPKRQSPQNQIVTPISVQKLHVYKQSNIVNNINKEKKKDNLKEGSLLNTGSMLESFSKMDVAALAYKNTTDERCKKTTNEVQKKIKAKNFNTKTSALGSNNPISATLSKNTRLKILNDKKLAKQLTENSYEGYIPIEYKDLRRIFSKTDLNISDFTELLTQDFVKSSAKLYKNRNVYEGEWMKAINRVREDLFTKNLQIISSNVSFYTSKIDQILRIVSNYRGMLEMARKILLKNNNTAQYPYEYFNPIKTETKQMCFFGLKGIYLQKLRKAAENKAVKKNENATVYKKRKKIRQDILIEKALLKFTKGTYSFENLCNYVSKNHPSRFNEIANMINLNAIKRC